MQDRRDREREGVFKKIQVTLMFIMAELGDID
jgi:hypothetical protein